MTKRALKPIPKRLKIGPLTYTVTEVNDMSNVMPGQMAMGCVDFINVTIRLYSKMSLEKKWAVLMHEIVHAIDENITLELSEDVTDRLAIGLMDALTTNKIGLL